MSRVRLTDRRSAADAGTPYPGTVNQPSRTFTEKGKYDNWSEVKDHPLQNPEHGWNSDSRDEIGFGTPEANAPTVASIRAAASKAVKLAVLLLGDKVSEDVIEEQARDFMNLGPELLEGSLKRFSETEDIYATEDKKEDKKEDEKEDKKEDVKEDKKEDVKEDKDEKKKKSSAAELDIELGTSVTDEIDNDLDTQALLAQLYGESQEAEDSVKQTKEASSKKEGVKSLGGQPTKVASSDGQNEVAKLWADAPDVSDVFN